MVATLEIGDRVMVPRRFIPHLWKPEGKIVGKKIHPLPICKVEIKLPNGVRITVDVRERDLHFIS